jgi:ribonuclease-3 family protein
MEKSIDIFENIKNGLELEDIDIVNYSPLTLAYIGDAIYEIVIRTYVVAKSNVQVNKLHKQTSNLVKAKAQSDMIKEIYDDLTEQEIKVYKRGRNAKSVSMAKNASVSEYRTATGFEALMGYLYLNNESDRMIELIKKGLCTIKD